MDALTYFESLEPVSVEEMLGVWRGATFPSGHPADGFLEELGWYGKEFRSAEFVHPLLFTERRVPLRAALLPVRLLPKMNPFLKRVTKIFFPLARLVWRTEKSYARLRLIDSRGVVTAAMVYDSLPIIDVFRRVDADTVLGLMDQKGSERPFFFLLTRADASIG